MASTRVVGPHRARRGVASNTTPSYPRRASDRPGVGTGRSRCVPTTGRQVRPVPADGRVTVAPARPKAITVSTSGPLPRRRYARTSGRPVRTSESEPSWSDGVDRPHTEQPAVAREDRVLVVGLARDVPNLGVGPEPQPGPARREPRPGCRGPRHRRPRLRAIPPLEVGTGMPGGGIDALFGRHGDIAHADLLAVIEERRPAHRERQDGRGLGDRVAIGLSARDRRREARGLARLVMVREDDGRPAIGSERPFPAPDRRGERARRPGPRQELPVEDEMPLRRQRGRALGGAHEHLPHRHPPRGGIHDGPEPRQQLGQVRLVEVVAGGPGGPRPSSRGGSDWTAGQDASGRR